MKLFDIETVASFLGVSRQSVGRLITDGALTAITIRSGKRKRILRVSDATLKKFLGLKPGDELALEPALVAEKKQAREAKQGLNAAA
jgi:hypothetical protein